MKITFLGTGTSVGVPMIGCQCATCVSEDSRDQRLRASIVLEHQGQRIIIDTSTDFRQQALRAGISDLDAIFITHCHADHVFGLDDIRPINFLTGRSLPVFASEHTWHDLRQVFSYVFRPRAQHSLPQLVPHVLAGVFQFGALTIEPLEVIHGKMLVTAFRIATPASAIAYVTDCNEIPAATLARLTDLDLLIIDALRYREHPTHLWLDRTLQYIAQLQPRQALLTHISHDMQHALLCQELPAQVRPAYDNLTVEFP